MYLFCCLLRLESNPELQNVNYLSAAHLKTLLELLTTNNKSNTSIYKYYSAVKLRMIFRFFHIVTVLSTSLLSNAEVALQIYFNDLRFYYSQNLIRMWIIRYSEKYICTTAKRSFETKVGIWKGRTENGGVKVLSTQLS